MSKERIIDFINKQFENLDNFNYEIEVDENHTYAIFTEILSAKADKEMTFKLLDDILYLHSITYGWKPVEKGSANKYFWLELLDKKRD
jgi:hypothetical protein